MANYYVPNIVIILITQGSTLEKKPWGQLAPNFLDLVAKKFSAQRAENFYLKTPQYKLSTLRGAKGKVY